VIPNDPFVKLIIYLILAGGAIWALKWALTEAGVRSPWLWLITLVIGLLLILLAFSMAGLPLFA
jgi:hypothetical protein